MGCRFIGADVAWVMVGSHNLSMGRAAEWQLSLYPLVRAQRLGAFLLLVQPNNIEMLVLFQSQYTFG
jgi:hypothetical protein